MEQNVDSQPTQPSTQTVLDPRRLGKQNSGFSDEDIADIICLLIPYSDTARREVTRIALEHSQYVLGREEAEHVDLDYTHEDRPSQFDPITPRTGSHYIALRLSATVKNPVRGFVFGRNAARCDFAFVDDPRRRLSNVHFRIYINEYGVLMLEDQSTNGTIVDGVLLKSRSRNTQAPRRTLSSGSKISLLSHADSSDLAFLVRIPRREGDYDEAYRANLILYRRRLTQLDEEDQQRTITAGPAGHVDLFAPEARRTPERPRTKLPGSPTQPNVDRISKDWNGSHHYNRVGQIGKGAFAIVHKVTSKFDGKPYAAKELDKRKFMKNGILDQKVENEMRIMQSVTHPNIVQYIEHFDWDNRLFIIIMEFVPGGDLGGLVSERGPLPEVVVKDMALQLLDAMNYLHQKNITHRDVKPDNILVQSLRPFVVKLTDFGLSKMVDNEETFLRTFCGTLLYCAPEVYSEFSEYDELGRRNPRNRQRRAPPGQRYNHAIDIWSLGGVLFYALTKSPPYPVKTGISYSELLNQIMTKPLDVSPLVQAQVSNECINFLTRMLQRRPEHRATISDLMNHSWLAEDESQLQTGSEVTADDLHHGASQLSLADPQNEELSDDEILDDFEANEILPNSQEPKSDDESQKENYTFSKPPSKEQRLFGEVNVSAIGSSGAIPENRLNLPVSGASLEGSEIGDDSEIHDSFESRNSSTPRQPKPQLLSSGLRASVQQSHSVDELNNMTFDVSSQDLGGAESILGNMHMKSLAASNFQKSYSEFNTSKRKPSFDTSDEFEPLTRVGKPSIKRLKSGGSTDVADVADEDHFGLYALIPPISRGRPQRQIDDPVHKATFWTAGDPTSHHLQYPEMTQLQYDAFDEAARSRGEAFRPGQTALWELAMKHFPPASSIASLSLATTNAAASNLSPSVPGNTPISSSPLPSTAPMGKNGEVISGPDPQDENPIVVPIIAQRQPQQVVATLESAPSSLIPGIFIPVVQSFTSWGRARENTNLFANKAEVRVPKYAFKILLWKETFDPAKDVRPWSRGPVADEKSFFFYISTKATNGIWVNGIEIKSYEPKKHSSASRHWVKLYDGDSIVTWRDPHAGTCLQLDFRCGWGGSSQPRPKTSQASFPPPLLVPDAVARRLDELCLKTEKRADQQARLERLIAEADQDVDERKRNIMRERDRSAAFETKRAEACRALLLRSTQGGGSGGSRRQSPAASEPPPRAGWSSPDPFSYAAAPSDPGPA